MKELWESPLKRVGPYKGRRGRRYERLSNNDYGVKTETKKKRKYQNPLRFT